MKRGAVDDELEALRQAKADPSAPGARDRLRKALDSKHGFVVIAAAELIAQAELSDLLPLLPPVFDRFLVDAQKTDRGCSVKAAVLDALQRGAYEAPELYLRGAHYVQEEVTWDKKIIDTAGGVRGLCGFGLARIEHPEALNELAELLADPEPIARAEAARAIACAGQEAGIPLLRHKAIVGDKEPQVMSEVFGSLLALSPRTLRFVARFLSDPDEAIAEAAALAIGESRREGALDLLRPYSEELSGDARRNALIAIALLRSQAAIDYLLSLIEGESPTVAAQTVAAMSLYRHDEAVRRRVEEKVTARGGAPLQKAFLEAFPPA